MIKYIHNQSVSHPKLHSKTCKQIKQDFGFLAEPFMLHAASSSILAASWILVRETVLVGTVERRIKEVVATAVSESNQCPYCVDAHTIMFNALGDVPSTSLHNHPNEEIRLAYEWGLATRTLKSVPIQRPSFTQDTIPEILGTALAFHYINRMVSVFLDETPLPLHNRWFKRIQQQMAAFGLKGVIRRNKIVGESLPLLPDDTLKPSLDWLDDSTNVGKAIGKWAYTIHCSGELALTEIARNAIIDYLQSWYGIDPPLGTDWLNAITADLQGEDHAGATLGLVTALCPYRMTRNQIDNYRRFQPSDSTLVAAAAWASMQAAIRIASSWKMLR